MVNKSAYETIIIGAGIGGLILIQYDWGIFGIVLGGIGLCGTLIYYLFAIDPSIVLDRTKDMGS